MEVDVEKYAKTAVIKLSGRLDVNTSPDLRKAVFKLYNKSKYESITIDFSEVSFIDTSGLATLLEILVAAKERSAQLILSNLSDKLEYLIDVNGLTAFFTIRNAGRERIRD